MERSFAQIERNAGRILAAILAVTALLVIPLLAMEPEHTANQDPQAEVFETQDLVEDRFRSSVYAPVFVVEARDGNMLPRATTRVAATRAGTLRVRDRCLPR